MKMSMKRKIMQMTAKVAFALGRTTAMSISRLGSFEPMEDEIANRLLNERRIKPE